MAKTRFNEEFCSLSILPFSITRRKNKCLMKNFDHSIFACSFNQREIQNVDTFCKGVCFWNLNFGNNPWTRLFQPSKAQTALGAPSSEALSLAGSFRLMEDKLWGSWLWWNYNDLFELPLKCQASCWEDGQAGRSSNRLRFLKMPGKLGSVGFLFFFSGQYLDSYIIFM